MACSLGRAGRRALKREGDMASPMGCWRMVEGFYRADRLRRPRTLLPLRPIRPDDGWCDDPAGRNYNRLIKMPCDAGYENLWREDHAYDLLVVLDYNLTRRSIGLGSAIFLHLFHDDGRPTAGCLALGEHDLRQLLAMARPGEMICI